MTLKVRWVGNLMTPYNKGVIIIKIHKIITKELQKMKTRGWYLFADGAEIWFNGLSAREKKSEIRKHGAIIRFMPTA